MNLLLDTHVLIWWLLDSKRIGKAARRAILRPGVALFISAVSIWEIAIKTGTGRLKFKDPPEKCVPLLFENGFLPLPITVKHALAVRTLPQHHNDPFDRMIIAQAQCEDLTLMTADSTLEAYDIHIIDAAE
jgi:PIN domain nuclease of toxin-antitoxin system